jgi:hypothetical protein
VLRWPTSTLNTCLTPVEQIIKYCLNFLSKTCRYCAARLTAAVWPAQGQSYRRAYGYGVVCIISHSSVYTMCNKRVKHSVTYISFVRQYAIQFNTQDFHRGNLYKKSYDKCPVSRCFISFEIKHVRKSKEVISNTYCNMRPSYITYIIWGNLRLLSFLCVSVLFSVELPVLWYSLFVWKISQQK